MTEISRVKSNIWKLQAFSFIDMFTLFLPFIVYYFQELGFSLGEIAVLQSSMAITLFVSEIPSGYIADRFGRKNSLIFSVIMQVASIFLLYSAHGFGLLVLAHIFMGISASFLSGADSALVYDSLLVMKKEHEYKKIYGMINFYGEIAVILSAILGSLVVLYGIKATILLTLFGHCILLMLSFSLAEPAIHKPIQKIPFSNEIKKMLEIIKRSVYNKKLLGIFLYSFIVLGVSNTIFIIYQPYFREVGINLSYYGLIFSAFSVFTAFAAFNAHKIEKRLGVMKSLFIMPVFLVLSLFGAGFFFLWFGIVFFLFRELVRGFIFPVVGDYTNRITSSSERATVLSIWGMFSRLGLVAVSVSFGFLSDAFGMRQMLIITGLFLSVALFFIFFIIRLNSIKKRALCRIS